MSETAHQYMSVPQRGSVWVVATTLLFWPDTIRRQPTRYRVVVLTFTLNYEYRRLSSTHQLHRFA
jgi:hypothetical protein